MLDNLDKLLYDECTENAVTLQQLLLIFEQAKTEMLKLLTTSLNRIKIGTGLGTQIVSLRQNSMQKLPRM